jgi:hypothetical protein
MKFDDYEREFYSRYYEFAETVKAILESRLRRASFLGLNPFSIELNLRRA